MQGLKKRIQDYRPSVAGLTSTSPVFPAAIEICDAIKSISQDIKTVVGGIHPTVAPDDCIKPASIDFIVIGEGEKTIVELLDALQKAAFGDLSAIHGLAWKPGGTVKINVPRELISDLDTIPFPARHLFRNQAYTYPDSLSKRTFPIITSRGCPGNCTYCCTQNIFGRHFRARSAKSVVDEIEMLVKKYRAQEIHIWDDNFTTLKNRVFEINDELKKRKIKVKFAFPNGLRADFLSQDVLQALKDMGVYSVAVGVESGVQQILDNVNKRVKLENIVSAFERLKKMKFETWAFFLFGLPGDTKDTIKQTTEFAVKLNPDIAKFHILKPFPGTEVYRQLKAKNLITSEDLRKYGIHTEPVHHLENLSAGELLQLQQAAYRRFFFRPGKVIQQVLRLKTWNRVRLNFLTGVKVLKSGLVGKK
ncbi:MAG: hypothetical protein A2297_06435 [Elusimicrobia bacterium RIFOXYB2_FULL_48_7]|nr:MAG: hypothetical protein A2297_06435 [Elusimicrobia bacterium RIFOXYB2_FULL_48_7]